MNWGDDQSLQTDLSLVAGGAVFEPFIDFSQRI